MESSLQTMLLCFCSMAKQQRKSKTTVKSKTGSELRGSCCCILSHSLVSQVGAEFGAQLKNCNYYCHLIFSLRQGGSQWNGDVCFRHTSINNISILSAGSDEDEQKNQSADLSTLVQLIHLFSLRRI